MAALRRTTHTSRYGHESQTRTEGLRTPRGHLGLSKGVPDVTCHFLEKPISRDFIFCNFYVHFIMVACDMSISRISYVIGLSLFFPPVARLHVACLIFFKLPCPLEF